MKKLIVMLLALAVVFGVCACSEEKTEVQETVSEEIAEVKAKPEEEAEEPAEEEASSEETEQPAAEVQTLEEPPVQEPAAEEPAKEETPAPEVKTASAETASKYIGQSTSALVAAIGEPNSKTYASSCIGDGEDGEWYYDGFTVYTYRENGSERVEDVF